MEIKAWAGKWKALIDQASLIWFTVLKLERWKTTWQDLQQRLQVLRGLPLKVWLACHWTDVCIIHYASKDALQPFITKPWLNLHKAAENGRDATCCSLQGQEIMHEQRVLCDSREVRQRKGYQTCASSKMIAVAKGKKSKWAQQAQETSGKLSRPRQELQQGIGRFPRSRVQVPPADFAECLFCQGGTKMVGYCRLCEPLVKCLTEDRAKPVSGAAESLKDLRHPVAAVKGEDVIVKDDVYHKFCFRNKTRTSTRCRSWTWWRRANGECSL